jgi:hypothetical protein
MIFRRENLSAKPRLKTVRRNGYGMKISSALPTARMRARSGLRRLQAAAAIGLLMSGSALAQTVSDAKVQTANAEWRRLSQNEINCVDRSLHWQRSSVWLMIQRGIKPSDAAVASVRVACWTQARPPNAATVTHVESQAAGAMAAADKAPPEKAADKAAVDKSAGNKSDGDKLTIEKAAADKAAADKAAADKAAADKAAADKAAAEKAAADKTTADKAAADKAAADKVAADKAASDKAAADKAATVKTAAEKSMPAKVAPVAGNIAVDLARADAERATAEAMKARADADRARKEAEKTIADVGFALAAAESKLSFIYGLMGGLVLFGMAAVVFLAIRRKPNAEPVQPEAATPESESRDKQIEFDRMVAAVLDEQKRRDRKAIKPSPPVRKQPVEEPALV